MDTRLIAAAQSGDVTELRSLMAGNPLLFKPAELTHGENPLHIACMFNHVDFVKEVLYLCPGYAKELNAKDGLSPLHIASAYGYLDTVRELLKMGPRVCLVKSKDGKIPLHYAVMGGKIEVIDELISACLRSIKEVTDEKETCFHIAVKYNQFEALERLTTHVKLLSRYDAIFNLNRRDDQGNTALHLAASKNQIQVLDHLLITMKLYLRLNEVNIWGLTPLDIYVLQAGRVETVQDQLIKAGARRATNFSTRWRRMTHKFSSLFGKSSTMDKERQGAMLVIAALMFTITSQVVFNPPGGVWQDTVVLGSSTINNKTTDLTTKPSTIPSTELPHVAGTSIFATLYPEQFRTFLEVNNFAFLTSLVTLVLITFNIGSVAVLTLFVNYSLFALECIYVMSMIILSPEWKRDEKVPSSLPHANMMTTILYGALFLVGIFIVTEDRRVYFRSMIHDALAKAKLLRDELGF